MIKHQSEIEVFGLAWNRIAQSIWDDGWYL